MSEASDGAARIIEHWSARRGAQPFGDVPFGYLLTHPSRKILYSNDTLCEWIAYDCDDLVDQKTFPDLITVGGKIFYETHHNGLEALQGFTRELNYTLRTKARERIDVLVNTQRVNDAEGKHLYTELFLFRFSERQQYEKELLKAKKLAEENMRTKSQFLSSISHEVRTPLHTIVSISDLLRSTKLNIEQRDMLETLRFSADNLMQLIDDILAFSKLEEHKLKLHPTNWNLRLALRNMIKSFASKIDSTQVQLELDIDARVPEFVVADKVKLIQILNNLIGNAIKFTHRGQVRVSVRLMEHYRMHPDELPLEFRVLDTGIGIPLDQQEKVFQAFRQADSSISSNYGGTGLGLSIVRELIHLFNGKISLTSEVGQGTIFTFNLLLKVGRQIDEKLIRGDEAQTDLSAFRVLLVEDNENNAFIASRYFKRWKLKFDHATNGQEALDKLWTKSYDLVLMDVQMPVMDGLEATRKIRQLREEKFSNLPILVLSAEITDDLRRRLDTAGANDYILKPFKPRNFRKMLVKYLLKSENPQPMSEYDVPQLSELLDFFEGETSEVKEYLEILVRNWRELRERLSVAIAAEDDYDYGQVVHKMLTALRLLMLEKFLGRLKTARPLVNAPEVPDREVVFAALLEEFDVILQEIDRMIAGLDG